MKMKWFATDVLMIPVKQCFKIQNADIWQNFDSILCTTDKEIKSEKVNLISISIYLENYGI